MPEVEESSTVKFVEIVRCSQAASVIGPRAMILLQTALCSKTALLQYHRRVGEPHNSDVLTCKYAHSYCRTNANDVRIPQPLWDLQKVTMPRAPELASYRASEMKIYKNE